MDDLVDSLNSARHAIDRMPMGEAKIRLAAELETLCVQLRQADPTKRESLRRRVVSLHIVLATIT